MIERNAVEVCRRRHRVRPHAFPRQHVTHLESAWQRDASRDDVCTVARASKECNVFEFNRLVHFWLWLGVVHQNTIECTVERLVDGHCTLFHTDDWGVQRRDMFCKKPTRFSDNLVLVQPGFFQCVIDVLSRLFEIHGGRKPTTDVNELGVEPILFENVDSSRRSVNSICVCTRRTSP